MRPNPLTQAFDCLREAPTEAEMWAEFLPLVAREFDAAGSACLTFDESTRSIEWAHFYGPTSTCRADYVEQYATHDIYWPVLSASGMDKWITLSKSLPQDVLRYSPWYQDFVVPSGVTDVLGAQVFQVGNSQIFFGIHYEGGRVPVGESDKRLLALREHIARAARLGHARRSLDLRVSLGRWMLGQRDEALVIAYDTGRVIEMNEVAERLVAVSPALRIREGRLTACDSSDAARLAKLMKETGTDEPRRMLLGSLADPSRYLVTIVPLASSSPDEGARIVVRIGNLPVEQGSIENIAALFDLTPAECRVSSGILEGKTLSEMTQEFGVALPTLRAQLRSIFRRCGVQRQVDLVRLFLALR